MIDPEEFLSVDIEEQIRMIEKAEAPVHLLDVKARKISWSNSEGCQTDETYRHRFWYSAKNPIYLLRHHSAATKELLYRKNFTMEGSLSDGEKVRIECGLKHMVIHGLRKSLILEIAMDYYHRGWSTEGFVLSVFTHSGEIRPSEPSEPNELSLEHFALKQYLGSNNSVSGLIHDIYQSSCIPATKSMLILFEWMVQNQPTEAQEHQKQLQKYALEQLRRRPDIVMFNFCVSHGVPVGTLGHRDMLRLLNVMPPERYEEVIEQYKNSDNFRPDTEYYAQIILKRPDLVPDSCISESVLDAVLFSGSWERMMEMISKGFRFKDKEYRIYVACDSCHNGENHSCNWRYVSANFVCSYKTDLTLDQLHQSPPKPEKVSTYFDCWHADFNTPANDNELYIACGVGAVWDDETGKSSYLIPPCKISRTAPET